MSIAVLFLLMGGEGREFLNREGGIWKFLFETVDWLYISALVWGNSQLAKKEESSGKQALSPCAVIKGISTTPTSHKFYET